MAFSSVYSSEADKAPSDQNLHLWEQIGPRLTSSKPKKPQSTRSVLHLCTSNALSKHGNKHAAIDQEFMQTIESLHLLEQVVPSLARHNLQHGYFCFAKNICQVSDDMQELQRRHDIIAYLQENKEFGAKINELLMSLQSTEIDYLWNFYPKGQDSESTISNESSLSKISDFYFAVKKRIDSNRLLSEWWQRAKIIGLLAACGLAIDYMADFKQCKADTTESYVRYLKPAILMSVYTCGSILTAQKLVAGYVSNDLATNKDSIQQYWNHYLATEPRKEIALKAVNAPGVATTLTLSTFVLTFANIINLSYALKQDFDDVYRKQKSLIHTRRLISITEQISHLLNHHPRFLELMPELTVIKKFARYAKKSAIFADLAESKMQRFLILLNSKTFTGKPSYYFSWQGTIIETYTIYDEVKADFVKLWEALGAIDAQLSTYKLLGSQNNLFCLPTWVKSQEPILQLSNYWHPVLHEQEAVKNNILLGGNQQPRNVVVTGANAGGKTTALTAIMIAQILAQSIGIAPASECIATPFARLHTYLDITTNLEAHESLFMAQANRAQKLYQSISSCTSHQKSLTILDEIFTGTRADFAEKASYEFAKTLGQIPHSICLLATHFPKLTELESLNLYINYHAANATISDDGNLQYPYKIIPGISTQNIAEYILKRKGLLKE